MGDLYPNSLYPRTCNVAHRLGIDPNLMPVTGHDETGYLTVAVDGEPIAGADIIDGEPPLTRHPWPTPDAWPQFKAAWDTDLTEYFRQVITTAQTPDDRP